MSRPARSLLALLQRGVAARKPTVLTANTTRSAVRSWCSVSRTLCQFDPVVRSSLRRLCTKTGAPCEKEYPPLPQYHPDAEPVTKEVYIVQVKGLAWSCTAQDIQHFFSDCRIREGVKGIHLTMDKRGRPSGRAFLELEHEEDVTKALEKHRQYLGSRYVEVYEVTNTEAEAILKQDVLHEAQDGVVKLRGLPFSCTEEDVIQFFSGLDIKENGVILLTNAKGKRSGMAFVQFSNQTEADKALERDNEVIGNRYIEVFPSSQEDVDARLRKMHQTTSEHFVQTSSASQISSQNAHPQSSAESLHYIHMRGLPFTVSGEDIVRFFSPLVIAKILMECGPSGRLSGEADVFFRNHHDALAAMSRDKMNIGQRYIELFLNSVPERNKR